MNHELKKSDEEWKGELNPEAFRVLREGATEAPFSGRYNDFEGEGMFVCAGCGNPLFDSETKFHSGSGWPSFYDVVDQGNVELKEDESHGMNRTEVVCAKCGGHLGHVFPDGPKDKTGLRYCVNSCALEFNEK